MKHKYIVHDKECDCHFICRGGLAVCEICGCAEGELTTDCAGYKYSEESRIEIYAGRLDFQNGEWIPLVTLFKKKSIRRIAYAY